MSETAARRGEFQALEELCRGLHQHRPSQDKHLCDFNDLLFQAQQTIILGRFKRKQTMLSPIFAQRQNPTDINAQPVCMGIRKDPSMLYPVYS